MPRVVKFKPSVKRGPESRIKSDLKEYMEARGWLVEITHGNKFQTGFPDLYAAHRRWGDRWIDVKTPGRYTFTTAQRVKWPVWDDYRIGIWIMTAATQDEYNKLFGPPNWRTYWKDCWTLPDVDRLLTELGGADG